MAAILTRFEANLRRRDGRRETPTPDPRAEKQEAAKKRSQHVRLAIPFFQNASYIGVIRVGPRDRCLFSAAGVRPVVGDIVPVPGRSRA